MSRLRSSAPPFPRARSFAWLGVGFLAFIVYGSLAPFAFQALSAEEAQVAFGRVLNKPLHFESRSDVVTNILLMVPVSFCLMGSMGVDRSRWLSLGDVLFVLPICVTFSIAVEFAQMYLPNRTSSLEDIVAQMAGASFGALLWLVVGQKVTDRARWVWAPPLPVRLDARLLPAYLFVLALVHIVPLDLITSPVDLYRKYKSGLINLVPFRYPADDGFAYAEGRMTAALYFLILGLMLPGLPWAFWRDRQQSGRVLGWSLLLVGGVTGLKLLVASRGFDVTDVIVGALACLLGWEISLAVRQTTVEETRWSIVRVAMWASFLGWLALVTFMTWQPFDFDFTLAEDRLKSLPLIPFVDVLRGDPLNAFANLVQKMVLYLPLGVLVTTWRPTPTRFAWVPALVCGGLIALPLEVGQLFLSRTASLTDVYLEVAGAIVASVITRRVCESAAPASPFAALDRVKPMRARGRVAW